MRHSLYIVVFVLSIHLVASAKSYHVSPLGTDKVGNGTTTQPYKTLFFAVSQLAENDTLLLDAGVFVENAPLILPSGTSIIGAGMEKTIIKSAISMKVTHHQMPGVVPKYLILINHSTNWEISNITFDGLIGTDPTNEDHLAFAGIFASNVDNFKIHDVAVNNFIYNGIWVQYAKKFEVYNASLDNDGWGDQQGCCGLIHIGSIKDGVFHDIRIRENRGNDGIRTMQTPPDNNLIMSFKNLVIENVRMYNLDIKLRRNGAWGQGQPNEDIAFWNCSAINSEICHCRITDKIANQGFHNKTKRSTRIHHNQFASEPSDGPIYTYQIEHETHNSELDNNIFLNGIANLGNYNRSSENFRNYSIHNNLFYHPEGHGLFFMKASVTRFKFDRNFVLLDNNMIESHKGQNPLMALCKNQFGKNISVTHNLFISDNKWKNNADLLLKKDSSAAWKEHRIAQNLFHNWREQGTNAKTVTETGFNQDDFRFAYDSPIFTYGMTNLDVESIGLTKDYFFALPNDPLGMVWVKREGGNSSEIVIPLKVSRSVKLVVSGRTSTGFMANLSDADVIYTSNSPDIAKVENNLLTGLKKGVSRIDATVTKNGIMKRSAIYINVK